MGFVENDNEDLDSMKGRIIWPGEQVSYKIFDKDSLCS
jgi:hypothetical protein